MNVRTTKPEAGNKFYIRKANGGYSTCVKGSPTDKDCNVLSNCVGYACGRFNEIIGHMAYPSLNCNAENFIERAKSLGLTVVSYPTIGGIMVWKGGKSLSTSDGDAGHVAIVERIDSANQILCSESDWGGKAFIMRNRSNANGRWGETGNRSFRGCIINPAIGDIHYSGVDYTKGMYRLNYNKYIRKTPNLGNNYVKVGETTKAMRSALTSTNLNAKAMVKTGTIFTVLSTTKDNAGRIWAKNYSGYICIQNMDGSSNVTKQ